MGCYTGSSTNGGFTSFYLVDVLYLRRAYKFLSITKRGPCLEAYHEHLSGETMNTETMRKQASV